MKLLDAKSFEKTHQLLQLATLAKLFYQLLDELRLILASLNSEIFGILNKDATLRIYFKCLCVGTKLSQLLANSMQAFTF